VLSVDKKSQIQALDRTQPGLPMKKGPAGRTVRRPLSILVASGLAPAVMVMPLQLGTPRRQPN
jgi:hypothetical protein